MAADAVVGSGPPYTVLSAVGTTEASVAVPGDGVEAGEVFPLLSMQFFVS